MSDARSVTRSRSMPSMASTSSSGTVSTHPPRLIARSPARARLQKVRKMWVRRLIVSFYLAGSVSRELFSFLSLTRSDKHGHFRMRTSGFCWGIRRPLGIPPIRCGPRPRALINASWMPGWRLLRTGTIIFPEQLVRSMRQDAPSACFCGMFVTVGQECLKSSRLSSDRVVRNLSPFQLWFSFRAPLQG